MDECWNFFTPRTEDELFPGENVEVSSLLTSSHERADGIVEHVTLFGSSKREMRRGAGKKLAGGACFRVDLAVCGLWIPGSPPLLSASSKPLEPLREVAGTFSVVWAAQPTDETYR